MIALIFTACAALHAITADEIIEKLERNLVHSTARIEGEMTVQDRFGEKRTTFISFAEGESKTLIEFTSPEEEGQKILRIDDDIYLFFPDAEELIRMQGSALRQSVLGSDMSYEDLTGGREMKDSYNIVLEGIETVDGKECYKCVLTAVKRNVPYPKQIMWVDKDLFMYRKVEQYSLSGRLLKEVSVLEMKRINSKVFPSRTLIKDAMKKKSQTVFSVEAIQVDISLPEDIFSLEELTW